MKTSDKQLWETRRHIKEETEQWKRRCTQSTAKASRSRSPRQGFYNGTSNKTNGLGQHRRTKVTASVCSAYQEGQEENNPGGYMLNLEKAKWKQNWEAAHYIAKIVEIAETIGPHVQPVLAKAQIRIWCRNHTLDTNQLTETQQQEYYEWGIA